MSTGIVHIGIVSYNALDDLPACLRAIQAQTYPHYTVTIVDNNSQDGTCDWLANCDIAHTLIRSSANVGFARAHNAIIARLPLHDGTYYLALNPDATLAPDYIAQLVDALQTQNADWGIGKLYQPDRRTIYAIGHAIRRDGYVTLIGHGLAGDDERVAHSRAVMGAPASACLYRARLIHALAPDGKLFDEQMFLYHEDTDVDWRAVRYGLRAWYCAGAIAYHRGSQPARPMRLHALSNRYVSVIKNATWRDLLLYNLPVLMLHIIARLLLSPRAGVSLVRQTVRRIPHALRNRSARRISQARLAQWFAWSRQQVTSQPSTLRARLRRYRQH